MKSIKLLGLAVIAALALTASAGPSSASATVLCESNTSPCGETWYEGVTVRGKLKAGTNLTLEIPGGAKVNETCTGSEIAMKETALALSPLPFEVTSSLVSGCGGLCTNVEELGVGYPASLERTESGNGTMTLEAGKGNPGFKLSGCPFGATCTFGANKIQLSFEGGNPASMVAKKTSLTREAGSEFVCGNTATLVAAAYEVISPKPVYVSSPGIETTLCKENSTGDCPSASAYPPGTTVSATLKAGTNAIFEGKSNEKCTGSTLTGKTEGRAGRPLLIEIIAFTFSGCEKCTSVELLSLPHAANLENPEGGNGTFSIPASTGSEVAPRFKLSGCPLGVTCTFATGGLFPLFEGGNPAALIFKEKEEFLISGSEFFCGSSAKFIATYEITAPKPVYVTTGT